MTRSGPRPRGIVRKAVILAAGNGDRFQTPTHDSKLLQPLLGRPILLRTLAAAAEAGMQRRDRRRRLPGGSRAGARRARRAIRPRALVRLQRRVAARERRLCPRGAAAHRRRAVRAADGRSRVRAARARAHAAAAGSPGTDRCSPSMPAMPATSRPNWPPKRRRCVATARASWPSARTSTTTTRSTPGCSSSRRSLFGALEAARAQGDTTLSGGVRQLAARGLMHAVEIGGATWCDIDTVSDLAAAESVLAVARTA